MVSATAAVHASSIQAASSITSILFIPFRNLLPSPGGSLSVLFIRRSIPGFCSIGIVSGPGHSKAPSLS